MKQLYSIFDCLKKGSLPEKQGGGRVTPLVVVFRPGAVRDRSPLADIPGLEPHRHHTLYQNVRA